MRRQIDEPDLLAPATRYGNGIRQQLRNRLIQPHLAALDHVAEQDAGEDLRDRPDLEHRVAVVARRADAHDAARAIGFEQPDHYADLAAHVDDAPRDVAYHGIGREVR